MSRKNENGEGSFQSPAPELQRRSSRSNGEVLRQRRVNPFLVACRCFSFITALTAILCIAVNVLSAVRSFKDGSDVFDGIFRCYAVIIAFFVGLAETEWSFIFRFWKVLEYWVGRGMLQIFVAVVTRAFPSDEDTLVLLQNISCYMLIGCGVVYTVSELERRRQELEALLIENRV